MTAPIVAAGVVCWRIVDGRPRVLLVHRTQHKDVSLPKGKVDPGELLPQTAVRELREETGLEVTLGAPLGRVEYTLPGGRPKVVHYWTAEIDDNLLERSRFRANDEIAALEWLSIGKAIKKVSYEHDADMLRILAARIKAGLARTFPLVVARHGKAVPPGTWDGPDATRPLLHRGSDQAVAIAPAIAAFGPEKIVSSSAVRCVTTVLPLSQLIDVPIKQTAAISQDAYEFGQARVPDIVSKRLKRQVPAVLCSHGPVIPEIVREVARYTDAPETPALRHALTPDTGEFSVLHISRAKRRLVAVESHSAS